MVGRANGEQLNGIDDFDDGVRDISAWGDADTVVGDATLSEIDGRVQFTSNSGSGSDESAVRTWQLNRAATTNDWQAEVFVFLPYYLPLFADGQKVDMGLRVGVVGDPGRSADLRVAAMMASGVVNRTVEGAVQTNGEPVKAQEVAIKRSDSGGWIRFRFDASSKSLLTEFASVDQPGNWTAVSSLLLDSPGINWQLTDQDKFAVSLVAASNSYSVRSSDQVWFDNFLAASKPVILEQPKTALALYCEAATFIVSVDAGPLVTYQWRHQGTNLVGEVSRELNVSEFVLNRDGNYDVVVGNPEGTTVSETASLVRFSADFYLMSIVSGENDVRVSWSKDCQTAASVLQTRSSFTGDSWVDVAPPYPANGDWYDVSFQKTGVAMFFRLVGGN